MKIRERRSAFHRAGGGVRDPGRGWERVRGLHWLLGAADPRSSTSSGDARYLRGQGWKGEFRGSHRSGDRTRGAGYRGGSVRGTGSDGELRIRADPERHLAGRVARAGTSLSNPADVTATRTASW